ncbi:MAG: endopeptidase La [Desulfobulbaceae bacterium]|jgi:ATP-dependent Lon protease|nr:endopeptidase La [Desulfobulbaceae bacterium]
MNLIDDMNANQEVVTYPMMPLRDIVLYPHMVAPLVVGREKSIAALEKAMKEKTEIFLATQKDGANEDPKQDDVYSMGTIGTVMQLLRLPDGTIKALVEGRRRAEVIEYVDVGDYLSVIVEEYPEVADNDAETEAFRRETLASFTEYQKINKKIPKEILVSLSKISAGAKFIDVLASHLPLKTEAKHNLLKILDVKARFAEVLAILQEESEIANLEQSIRKQVKTKIDKIQRDYYLNEQVKVIHKEMGREDEASSEIAELAAAVQAKKLPKEAREKADKELKKLKQMSPMSAEATVVRNYIDAILSLPWAKKTRGNIKIDKAEAILNEDHYGLKEPKERILEYLAVQAQVKKIKGPILCLVGPPGVGKTSICQSVARAMGRKFTRQSLGGVRDEAEIRGHRRTYIGAMPGKIIQSLQKVKVSNPVFCLDEIDKMAMDFRGDPSSALLEVLDPEQNSTFVDHYLDLDYDLSDIFFITTANNLYAIPAPLRDRMEIISLSGYTEEDKLQIAKKYLAPKQLKENGFEPKEISLDEKATLDIIRLYTKEAGVRNLERTLGSICRKIAREKLKNTPKKKYRVTPKGVRNYLGNPRFRFGVAEEKDQIGLTTGLAWTEVGGELLQIETVLMPGHGKLTITGQLGDVMQESARAALSYVRANSPRLGLAKEFYQKLDIHVHVPEGAIPKDGPSAGVTLATTIVSALLRIPVRRDLAMTGEITLRGRVLPIGGLTEKLLAARRGNISTVLIPKENEKDLEKIPARVLQSLTVIPVEHADEVLQHALVLPAGRILFQDVPYEPFGAEMHNGVEVDDPVTAH